LARLAFALRMATERWKSERSLCPYCESRFSLRLQRKWLLIEARQCIHCGLIFRWPTDPEGGARDFYEKNYDGQHATDMPTAKVLDRLVAQNFVGSSYDKSDRVLFLQRTLGASRGRKLLDFGTSWGYSLHQYKAAGWRVAGFELDRHRAKFGRDRLNLTIHSTLDELRNQRFDVVLSDHALEHVSRPGKILDIWTTITKGKAALVIFVPNASCAAARRLGVAWGPFIGEAHTVAFTMQWFMHNLPRHGWQADFYGSDGLKLPTGEYLMDHGEICVVARCRDATES
jgi:2-polyprenyl-3-methyl-5-hydroxy-6-metoxy-1,4-benzoquinol methylase